MRGAKILDKKLGLSLRYAKRCRPISRAFTNDRNPSDRGPMRSPKGYRKVLPGSYVYIYIVEMLTPDSPGVQLLNPSQPLNGTCGPRRGQGTPLYVMDAVHE